MYTFSDNEIREQALSFMRDYKISPRDEKDTYLKIDGKIHRYSLEGDRHGEKSGAYVIYNDGVPSGYFQNWKTGFSSNWTFYTENLPKEQWTYFNSPEFLKQQEENRKKREAELKEKQAKASELAHVTFEQLEKAPCSHPYLAKKNISPHNLRINGSANVLAVPLYDITGKIISLQWINADGIKRFFQDAPIKGAFWYIALNTLKNDNSDIILLGEGVATMAKVHELTEYPCVAAMNCGNLYYIAQELKGKFPQSTIIVMADDDKETENRTGRNPGKEAAQKVVQANLARAFLLPPFKNPSDGTDWDDLALKYGNDYVSAYLKELIPISALNEERKKLFLQVEQINAQTLRKKIFPPVVWAVDGFLPSGLSVLAGGPKVGKSILSLHLSLAVAIGGCALGQITVEQGAVLYLALEDTQRRLQERIEGSGLPEDCNLSLLTLATRVPRQHEGGLEYIRFWLETQKRKARLVIIDTLQKFRKVLSNKGTMYAEDYEVISEIKKLADEFDVPFLLIHHLKKAMQEDWLEEISGSQGIAGAADTIFALKRARTENKGILHRTGRDVEEKDFEMRLDGFNWILEGEKENFTMPEWEKNIITYLKEHGDVTPMDLSTAIGLTLNTAQQQLKRLAHKGAIKKTGYGKYSLTD